MNVEIPIVEQSDGEIMDIIRQLQVAYKLKRTLRYATKRDFDVHSESVAEHVFALFFLAQYFLPFEDTQHVLNVEKLYKILLFHDFGEIEHGDIPYHLKTEEDERREREAAEGVFASLPLSMQKDAYESWKEYEQKKSPEARFANALDKTEPLFELLEPVNERSMKRLKFTYRDHISKKIPATEDFPVMRKFVDVASRDMLKRGIFWIPD